jgi:hypothetical protein
MGTGSHKFRIRAVLFSSAAILIGALIFILNMSHSFSLVQAKATMNDDKFHNNANGASTAAKRPNSKNSKQKNNTNKPSVSQAAAAQAAPQQQAPIIINAKNAVYSGPGAVSAHDSFSLWLGKPVVYATDYIDYKGGWQKDFVDSKVWLIKPWSDWVKAGSGRRLVLGLPMLENENYGQFDQGVNGAFDTYFNNLANELTGAGLGNSIIRLGYEANCDTIGPWQATSNPAGYRLLFRHIAAVMKSAPGNSFAFDWSLCNGLQNGKALNSFDSFYPGDDVADIIGMDIYDVKWQDPSASPQQRWQYLLARKLGVNEFVQYARAHGKTISYPEWGLYKPGDAFAGGGDNPYFITKMAELFSSTNPLYQSYFNLDWGGGKLFDFPQGKAAYKQIFGG